MRPPLHPPEQRWGEAPPEPQRLSGLAVMAALAAGFSLACGLLAGLLPASATMHGPGRLVSAMLVALNLATFPAAMILAYAALWRCRLDSPVAGRPLAWLALGISYVSLLSWYVLWSAAVHRLALLGVYLIAAIMLVHLLVFAAESRAGRSIVVGLVIGATLFTIGSLWLYRSMEESRRLRAQHNLTRIGKGMQEQQERHRSAPGFPGLHAAPQSDATRRAGAGEPSTPSGD